MAGHPRVSLTPVPASIPPRQAVLTWLIAWVLGAVVLVGVVLAVVGADGTNLTIPELLLGGICGWGVFLAALWAASQRFGTGDPLRDYAVQFRPIDAVGVPLGVVSQLLLIPGLYAPLRAWWPDTFTDERLEETARDLVDRADGVSMLILVVIVVVAAPVVEELVYRGLLQRSISNAVGRPVALVLVSVWFALIHFRPIEYPGLALAGLVFGGCVVATNRLGPAIVTHAAFNATGLILAASSG